MYAYLIYCVQGVFAAKLHCRYKKNALSHRVQVYKCSQEYNVGISTTTN